MNHRQPVAQQPLALTSAAVAIAAGDSQRSGLRPLVYDTRTVFVATLKPGLQRLRSAATQTTA
jgi:hypothetical protein